MKTASTYLKGLFLKIKRKQCPQKTKLLKNILEENLDRKTIHDSELCTQSPRNEYEKLLVSKLVADLNIFNQMGKRCRLQLLAARQQVAEGNFRIKIISYPLPLAVVTSTATCISF